jgi:hypothetical protein
MNTVVPVTICITLVFKKPRFNFLFFQVLVIVNFPWVRKLERKADKSLISCQFKNLWSHTSTPPISLRGVKSDSFTFVEEIIVYWNKTYTHTYQ